MQSNCQGNGRWHTVGWDGWSSWVGPDLGHWPWAGDQLLHEGAEGGVAEDKTDGGREHSFARKRTVPAVL